MDLTKELFDENNQKNYKLINPKTKNQIFGKIPDNRSEIPSGLIYLRLGYVGNGYNRQGAFGARHIWEKHRNDLNLNSPQELPIKLSEILTEGVEVLYEDKNKPVVLNTTQGIVSLQQKRDDKGNIEYSIISAYYKTQARGIVFCKLEMP